MQWEQGVLYHACYGVHCLKIQFKDYICMYNLIKYAIC